MTLPDVPRFDDEVPPQLAARRPGALAGAVEISRQQLAGQPLAPVAPTRIIINGRDYGPLSGALPTYEQREPAPPPGYDFAYDDPSQIPNYEKLTGLERFVMNTVPGISTPLAEAYARWDAFTGGVTGKVLRPLGAILGVLDVGAEFLERSVGLATQWAATLGDAEQSAEFARNLNAAWYAGSLASDAADMSVRYDPQTGLSVPQELGGLPALIAARQRIAQLTAQGITPREALATARDEYYSSLGALAIRAQLQDLGFHLLADPLNIILGALKPVERAAILRRKILTLETAAASLPELEKGAEAAESALRLAQQAGDAAEIARAQQKAVDAAAALKMAERSTLSWGEQKLTQLLGGGDQGVGAQRLIRLTGGDPSKPVDITSFWYRRNPFALTPEARAHELMVMVNDNIQAYVVAANRLANGRYDVEGIVRAIQRAADGVRDPKLGQMVLSVEGRTVRAALQGFSGKADELLAAYRKFDKLERPLLEILSEGLGVNPHQIIARIAKGQSAQVLAQFTEKLAQNADLGPRVAQLLAANELAELTPDVLGRLGKVLGGKEFAGYTDDLFVAELMGAITDQAARQAIVQFGVKAHGLIANMANMVKSAEALAFLRANPGYPIRNFINNEFTTIARGAWGNLLPGQIDAYWAKQGFLPARLKAGIGAGEIGAQLARGEQVSAAAHGLGVGEQILTDAARANAGWLGRATDAIKNFRPLGRLDTGHWAAKLEQMASKRAYTTYYIKGMPQFYRAALGKAADFDGALARLPRSVASDIENMVLSAKSNADLDALLSSQNIKLNIRSILARVEKNTGMKLDTIIGEEFVASIEDDLMKAARIAMDTGDRVPLRQVFTDIEAKVQTHLDDALDGALATLRDEAAARVAADGPAAYSKLFADVFDEWWGAHERHGLDIERLVAYARKGKGAAAADLRWSEVFESEQKFWGRAWNRLEARIQGFADQANKIGLPGADGVMSDLRQWRAQWQTFFTRRNTVWRNFWKAVREGKRDAGEYLSIKASLNDEYRRMIDLEARFQRKIDVQVANWLPEGQRNLYLAWRDKVANFRLADKETVLAFNQRLPQIPASQLEIEWRKHWQQRIDAFRMLRNEEQAGLAALLGNGEAQQRLAQKVQQLTQELGLFDQLGTRVARGEQLAPDEMTAFRGVVDKYAMPDELDILRGLDEADAADARLVESIQRQPGDVLVGDTIETTRGTGVVVSELAPARNQASRYRVKFGSTGETRTVQGASVQRVVKEVETESAETIAARISQRQADRESVYSQVFSRLGGQAQQTGEEAAQATAQAAPANIATLPNSEALVKPELYLDTGIDQLWYTRGRDALNAIRQATEDILDEPATRWADLGDDMQPVIRRLIEHAKGALADARYASMRLGEFGRDSALLNYNRRFNYNTWLGTMVPFEFWATQSAWKWALHSIDRPGMLAAYLRIKKFLDTAYRPEEGLPSRLRGHLRLPLPFLPDWMGTEVFFDPFKLALPFDNWMQPFEQATAQEMADVGSAQRHLEQLLNDGEIDQAAYDNALATHQGEAWEQAVMLARQDDTEGRQDWGDFAAMLFPPHLPLLYAYDAARGKNPFEERGSILPITRSIGAIQSMFGMDPAGGLNVEAQIRKRMGLHPFGKWDDYLVDRMIANMAATGDISVEAARLAMIERRGPAYDEAYRRAGIERYGGNAITAALSLAAIPLKGYPPGEEHLRRLQDDYSRAWDAYDAAVERGSDNPYDETVGAWLKEHPEYEARLALFKKPEERLQTFLVDEFWDTWNNLPSLTRNEISAQLGPQFEEAMFNETTGWGRNTPPEQLAYYLKLMGATVPGTLETPPAVGGQSLQLTPPDTAQRVQVFYDLRNRQFPFWREFQDAYFDLPEGAQRKQYLASAPGLRAYWDWRRNFLTRNTDIIPYVTDDEALNALVDEGAPPQFNYSAQEWQTTLGYPLYVISLHAASGETVRPSDQAAIMARAQQLGWQGDFMSLAQVVSNAP